MEEFVAGWYKKAQPIASPFFNERPAGDIDLLVIHNISLPHGQFGLPYIEQLFTGCLDCQADQSFADLSGVEVSAHFLIKRTGQLIQFVSTDKRAWHAGISSFAGVENCNNYSIGIELEGTDVEPFEPEQYQSLIALTHDLMKHYPIKPARIVGHSDIAPQRKTDPGPCFDWQRYKNALAI